MSMFVIHGQLTETVAAASGLQNELVIPMSQNKCLALNWALKDNSKRLTLLTSTKLWKTTPANNIARSALLVRERNFVLR